ncbi:MAG: DUF1801 domain-containing protein [Dokdonella sp.]|uniref:DUF1801 domain-containing protein n=1 Tax=Dokdonella sp. TaxID=2291710 RepID=UPI0032668D1B
MADNKTKATRITVESYLAAIGEERRRTDCESLVDLMTRATGEEPVMWGASIVGFGSYHYKYESGREGDSCLVGFSSRKGDISVYLSGEFPDREGFLAKLGKHKSGKACIYIRTLGDVDTTVLQQMVAVSVAHTRQTHEAGG